MHGKTYDLLTALRPRQWLKNVVVFAPLVFAAAFFNVEAIIQSITAFFTLCLLSGSVYITNDLIDREKDCAHPTKRERAIASGRLPVGRAIGAAFIFSVLGLLGALFLNQLTFLAALGFLAINVWYSFGGKNIAILDVMLIGFSFVMRVLVGAVAIGVPASIWLLLVLFFLATYLGFTKRNAEFKLSTIDTRASLDGYTAAFLDHARSATLAVTLALYTLYTFTSSFGYSMVLTVPFVFFGLMRYQAIADKDAGDNDGPADHIYQDRQLQTAIIVWGIMVCGIILFGI